MQVKCQVERLVAAIKLPYVLQCQSGSYPAHWAQQQTNTQLFEVDLMSPEVADLAQTFRQQAHLEIVKVHHTFVFVNKHTARYMTLQMASQHYCDVA